MKISKKLLNKYNQPETLIVLSSYPAKGREIAVQNAVSRYTYLLLKNFPKNKNIIVVCENSVNEKAFEVNDNILIVPSFTPNSLNFSKDVIRTVTLFNKTDEFHVQFEFSIFGGKVIIPQLLLILAVQKARGVYSTFMFHQVLKDIGDLSGHLGIKSGTLNAKFLNYSLHLLYKSVGILTNKIIVHDNFLKKILGEFIDSDKIEVIPHGSSKPKKLLNNIRKSKRSNLGIKDGEFVVLAFGYQSWYKGTDWVVNQIANISRKYPKRSIKLLLAGPESPTLSENKAYIRYAQKLRKLLRKNSAVVIKTGFIPEAEVASIFAASDLVIFPYRSRMSASGALAVTWQYGKPFLVSKPFSDNLKSEDVSMVFSNLGINLSNITFSMNNQSLEKKVINLVNNKGKMEQISKAGFPISKMRSWESTAIKYLKIVERGVAEVNMSATSKQISYA